MDFPKTSDLELKNGRYYVAGQHLPFTGWVISFHNNDDDDDDDDDAGKLAYEGYLNDGEVEGESYSFGYAGEVISKDFNAPVKLNEKSTLPEVQRVYATVSQEGDYCSYYLTFIVQRPTEHAVPIPVAKEYLLSAMPELTAFDCGEIKDGFTVLYKFGEFSEVLKSENIPSR